MKKITKLFLTTISLVTISMASIVTVVSCSNDNNLQNKKTKLQEPKTSNSIPNKVIKPETNQKFVILYSDLNKTIIKDNKTNKPYDNFHLALIKWRRIYHELISNQNEYEEVINTAIKSAIFNIFPNFNNLVQEISNKLQNNLITTKELDEGIIPINYMQNSSLNFLIAKSNNQFYSLIPSFSYTYTPTFSKNTFSLTTSLDFQIYLYNFSTNKKILLYSSNFTWELSKIKISILLSNLIVSRFANGGVINQKNIFGEVQFNNVHQLVFKQTNTKSFPGINAFSWVVNKDKLTPAIIFNINHNYELFASKSTSNTINNFNLNNWYKHQYLFYLPIQTSIITYNNGYNFGSNIRLR